MGASIEPGEIFEFNPNKLPVQFQQSIGLVAAASAQTESVVETAIGAISGIDFEISTAITTHMNSPLRDGVLRSVAEIRIDNLDALDELDVILDRIKEAFERRNDYVHNPWCVRPSTGEVFTVKTKARSSLTMDLLPMSVDKIEADGALIYEAGLALMRFLMKYGFDTIWPKPPRGPRGHRTKAARKERRKALGR